MPHHCKRRNVVCNSKLAYFCLENSTFRQNRPFPFLEGRIQSQVWRVLRSQNSPGPPFVPWALHGPVTVVQQQLLKPCSCALTAPGQPQNMVLPGAPPGLHRRAEPSQQSWSPHAPLTLGWDTHDCEDTEHVPPKQSEMHMSQMAGLQTSHLSCQHCHLDGLFGSTWPLSVSHTPVYNHD